MTAVTTMKYADGSDMYFYKHSEIPMPQLVDKPVKLKNDWLVVAVSEKGSKRFVFSKEDLVNISGMKTIRTPAWLENKGN